MRARRSWADARADCQSRGSDLATITTVAENAAAFAAVTAGGGYINGGVGTWIGLNDQAQEGNWVWADGSTSSYRNWGGPEPNGGTGENCAALWLSYQSGAQWNDAPCGMSSQYVNGYLCQGAHDVPTHSLAFQTNNINDANSGGSVTIEAKDRTGATLASTTMTVGGRNEWRNWDFKTGLVRADLHSIRMSWSSNDGWSVGAMILRDYNLIGQGTPSFGWTRPCSGSYAGTGCFQEQCSHGLSSRRGRGRPHLRRGSLPAQRWQHRRQPISAVCTEWYQPDVGLSLGQPSTTRTRAFAIRTRATLTTSPMAWQVT